MKRASVALLVLGIIVSVGVAWAAVARKRAQRPSAAPNLVSVPSALRAPEGQRVRVQVLNATRTRGLARRATMLLRDYGFDVVDVGTLAQLRDSTLVLDVSGHPDWATRVAAAFGGARVEPRPDSSRYLDIVVLLGASWRAPAEPFYP